MPRKAVKKPKKRKPTRIRDGAFVRIWEIAQVVGVARRQQGLSKAEAAHALDIACEQVERAESRYHHMLRLRKRMLEEFAGYTIDGPYYQLRRKHDD